VRHHRARYGHQNMDIGTINNNSSLTALAHLSAFGGFVGVFVCGMMCRFGYG